MRGPSRRRALQDCPLATPVDAAAIEANELWPVIGEHLDGSATVSYTKTHNARYDAQSVVIHRVIDEATRPKVACVNLNRASYRLDTPAGPPSFSTPDKIASLD